MVRLFQWLSIILCALSLCQGQARADKVRVAVSGRVVDNQARGVSGVQVRGYTYDDTTRATTDQDGRFTLQVDEQRVRELSILADDAQLDRLGFYKANWEEPPREDMAVEISLAPCRRLPVEVADSQGRPAAGVRVGAIIQYAPLLSVVTGGDGKGVLRLPTTVETQKLYATLPGEGFDYRVVTTSRDKSHRARWLDNPPVRFQLANAQTVQIRLVDEADRPIVETEVQLWLLNKPGEVDSFNLSNTPTEFRAVTDEKGIAEFRGVPDWSVHPLTFWPVTSQFVHQRITFHPKEHADGRLTVKLDRLVPVQGSVKFADGRPAADIQVAVVGAGYTFDGFRKVVATNEHGRFELGVAPNQLYLFAVKDQQWAAPAIDGLIVRPGKPIADLEFELRPATRVHGQVTVDPENRPVTGQRILLQQAGRDLHNLPDAELPNPQNSRRWVQPRIQQGVVTPQDGRFEFFVGPGKFTLIGPSQVKAKKFEVIDQSELEFNFAAPRPEVGMLAGRVVTGDPPQPVAGIVVEGKYRAASAGRDLRLRTDEQGRFSGERRLHATVFRAVSNDGKLAGIVEIGPDDKFVTIPIGPLASAAARLIDAPTGKPLAAKTVTWCRRVRRGDDKAAWSSAWGGSVTTDESGQFEITGLVVGQQYWLSVPRGNGSSAILSSVTPDAADQIELGDLELRPPYKPPTFAERVEKEFSAESSAGRRYDEALPEAERLRQHVLVVFLQRDAPLTESWFKLRLDDGRTRTELFNFQLLHVDAKSDGAAVLAKRLGVDLQPSSLPVWRFANAAGEPLAALPIPRDEKSGKVNRIAVLERLSRYAPEPLDARQLLKKALTEAAASNRRVIVQETATWCGPCHMLARYLERNRAIWEKDYLWIRIDQRWRGSEEVMNGIENGYRRGIPWFAILDGNADVLATSDGPDGNIGFPSKPASIDHFMKMIESTSQRMSAQERKELRRQLESR